jgi:hypothetical protein
MQSAKEDRFCQLHEAPAIESHTSIIPAGYRKPHSVEPVSALTTYLRPKSYGTYVRGRDIQSKQSGLLGQEAALQQHSSAERVMDAVPLS